MEEIEQESREDFIEIAKLLGVAISVSVRLATKENSVQNRAKCDRAWEKLANAVIDFAEKD